MSSSLNMSADDYIDYLYDDAEDFASNVDYTAPESYAYLGRILLKIITIYRILSFFFLFFYELYGPDHVQVNCSWKWIVG